MWKKKMIGLENVPSVLHVVAFIVPHKTNKTAVMMSKGNIKRWGQKFFKT